MDLNSYKKLENYQALSNEDRQEVDKIIGFVQSQYYDLNSSALRRDQNKIISWNRERPEIYNALDDVLNSTLAQLQPDYDVTLRAVEKINLLRELLKTSIEEFRIADKSDIDELFDRSAKAAEIVEPQTPFVKLENLKGIRHMTFCIPERSGVYVLAGSNGSGKTSLMIALNRLGDNLAFHSYYTGISKGIPVKEIDAYNNASITYGVGGVQVTYRKVKTRWQPKPKSKSHIIDTFPFANTLFINTTGLRFFSQDITDFRKNAPQAADFELRKALNSILGTNKFGNLKYLTISGRHGRRPKSHRSNKFYIIQEGGDFYSEKNFSLGERLVLNILEAINNIRDNTLLLIDEIELALHPVAQVRFYDYLKQKAREKNLTVIISTHSSTLIKHADHRYYLEDRGGFIDVHSDCYPAYILRTIASIEDVRPDFIFFVEDEMARQYLTLMVNRFIRDTSMNIICSVVPVGGWKEVIKFMQNFPSLSYPKGQTQAFLDQDVNDYYQDLLKKGNNKTDSETKSLELFKSNQRNISYLSITPELGIWEWMEHNPEAFELYFEKKHGRQISRVRDWILATSIKEAANKHGNLRNWAKGCFMNFKERVNNENHQISQDDVVKDMIDCYVENHYDKRQLSRILNPIFNRI